MVLTLAAAARGLVWHEWDDVFLVYQPSSAETHVFNHTTALILECLEQGPLSIEATKTCTEEALSLAEVKLPLDDWSFAIARLEELGLIERIGEVTAVQCSSVI